MTQDMATTRAISGHHESMLSQIEAGTTPLEPSVARALLLTYGLGARSVEGFLTLLARAQDEGHSVFDDGPGAGHRLALCVRHARGMRIFSAFAVPQLLRTRAYAQAVLANPLGDDAWPPAVMIAPLSAVDGRKITVVLEEAVLRRPYGGAAAMADQLARLQHAARSGIARILVVPFAAGIAPVIHGTLYELDLGDRELFANEGLYVRYASGSNHGRTCALHLDRVEAAALPPQQSLELIEAARRQYTDHPADGVHGPELLDRHSPGTAGKGGLPSPTALPR
ncbi:Scr1 family TA system antitoxin-like transcriptional regulator [Streptomyces sp. NBC_01304]|uniref:Scr1 family TA system antitoxin-like transcriptional regulator n=1 Tax=Streptomyces sp. NBC_01304 TaxID=2903818 RepID=UPI002E0D6B83|nr:DUF5753 domain-containing protein [Streptomyces sp. NBC_01304]